MAEYQITPYILTLYPARDRASPLQMGRVRPGKPELSVLDAFAKTFSVLMKEDKPRQRATDRNRKLDVRSVDRTQTQVEVTCSLGVAGYISRVNLKELGAVSATRDTDDFEWFDLRIVFAASPTARAGVLLVEGVGNFGLVTHFSELAKLGFRANVPDTTVEIKPIQDAQSWGKTFAALTTQAIEFHTLIKTGDLSDEAGIGGKSLPLKKIVKITRSGGLGPYSRVAGQTVKDIASKYGVGKDIDDDTWAVATLGGRGDRPRKINVQENRVSSISFPVKRSSTAKRPTPSEFYAVANQIVQDVRSGVGLGSLSVGVPGHADTRIIKVIDTTDWTVPDEASADPDSH